MFVNLRVVDGSFLSTLSLRRATIAKGWDRLCKTISIHALLAESDIPFYSLIFVWLIFLSTLSLRRATKDQSLDYGKE